MKVASDGQVPVGELLGEEDRPRSRWRAALRWRDWNLPVKLGAVTLIPIIIAVVLGGVTLANQLERANRYENQHQLAQASVAAHTLLEALQRERTLTAEALTAGAGVDSPELHEIRTAVDDAWAPLLDTVAQAGESLASLRTKLTEQFGALDETREQILAGQLDTVEAVEAYTNVVDTLVELDTAVAAGIGAEDLGATANAAHNLLVAREEVSLHQALIAHGIEFELTPSEFDAVRTAEVRRVDRLTEFSVIATERQRELFDDTVRGQTFDEYQRIVGALLSSQDAGSELFSSTTAEHWAETGDVVFSAMSEVGERLGTELADGTGALADDANTGVGVLAVTLLAALVLAALVVFCIARQLLRSLKILRNSALEAAQHELPEAVQAIQEGHTDDTEINQVPVHTRDEIGEVARAFDAVHSEALRLAAEQARMRAGYADVFVNLSRRSQSLVQRQLQLIERLERDEEDADQLATLFQLDHLATRMRRNNENLMVLSGAEPARRSGQPVSATDVLRAAVSEIEQYQRVVVRTPPSVSVVGYAAGDLIRLVAELLDNATSFSAPETQVTVATRQMDDGSLSIDILDKGIGMSEAEVAEANERLSEASSIDLTTSRRMGLFVVGRLANRHGFGVELHGGKDIVGVRATVTVPAEFVNDQQAPYAVPEPSETREIPESRPAEPGVGADSDNRGPAGQLQTSNGPLPRRKPGGSSRLTPRGGDGESAPEGTGSEMTGTELFTPLGWDGNAQGRSSSQRRDPRPATSGAGQARQEHGLFGSEAGSSEHGGEHNGAMDPAWPSETEASHELGFADARTRDRSDGEGEQLSGRKLFEPTGTAVSDWWSAAVTESNAGSPTEAQRQARKAAMENAETTPIFDEMVSAWFRKVTDAAGSGPAPDSSSWEFAADETWKTVQEVSQRQTPSEYTEAGLPRRRRGEQLLPGSATPDDGRKVETSGPVPRRPRDPAEVFDRLSSFQQGVTRGRRHRRAEASEGQPTPTESGTNPSNSSNASDASNTSDTRQSAESGDGRTDSGLPQRPRRVRSGAASTEPAPEETTDIVADGGGLFTDVSQPATDSFVDDSNVQSSSDATTSDNGESAGSSPNWAFAVDERWRTVEEVSRSVPTSYTAAGLPRRQRGERLLPGSAAPENQAEPRRRLPRDPADVRGRLASFQQGVRRGRHRTAGEADNADERLEGE